MKSHNLCSLLLVTGPSNQRSLKGPEMRRYGREEDRPSAYKRNIEARSHYHCCPQNNKY